MGLNSEKEVLLTTIKVDDIIVKERCNIVGIAYVLDLNTKIVKDNKECYIEMFLKYLKIPKEKKEELIFFVFSKWDKYYDEEEKIASLIPDFEKLLAHINLKKKDKTFIRWASKPSQDFKKYCNKFAKDEDGKEILNRQWDELGKIIKAQNTELYRFSNYERKFLKLLKKISKRVRKDITKNANEMNKKYKEIENQENKFIKKICRITIQVQRKKFQGEIITRFVPTFAGEIGAQLARISMALAIPSFAATGPVGISVLTVAILGGVLSLGFEMKEIVESLCPKSNKLNSDDKQITTELQKEMENLISEIFISKFLEKLQWNILDEMTIPSSNFFYSGEVFRSFTSQNPESEINQNTSEKLLEKGQSLGEFTFEKEKKYKIFDDKVKGDIVEITFENVLLLPPIFEKFEKTLKKQIDKIYNEKEKEDFPEGEWESSEKTEDESMGKNKS